ncbi:NAD(P)-binding protein [Streptomyces sp. NPDC002324]
MAHSPPPIPLPGHVDVLIVGAGISGIDAAYRAQSRCPDRSNAVLESRASLGGTWDLFRHPASAPAPTSAHSVSRSSPGPARTPWPTGTRSSATCGARWTGSASTDTCTAGADPAHEGRRASDRRGRGP